MESIPFAEYGVAIFAIGALVLVIRYFLKAARERDKTFVDYMQRKDEAFSDVINNHLTEDVQVKEKLVASNVALAKSHERLESVIDKLAKKL